MDEEPSVKTDGPRRPICMDCLGKGKTNQPKACQLRPADLAGSMWVVARCQACRGTGRAGA